MSKNFAELMNTCRVMATEYRVTFNDENKSDWEKSQVYNALQSAIDKYNDAVRADAYKKLLADADPVKKLIVDFSFAGIVKATIKWAKTADNEPKRISLVLVEEAKNEEIFNLTALADIVDEMNNGAEEGKTVQPFHDIGWREKVASLTRLYNSIEMRASGAKGSKFKTKGAARKDTITTYLVNGEAVTSNTADTYKHDVSMGDLKKATQDVVDSIVFDDNGKGKNVYMVKTEDVMYIFTRVTKYNPRSHRSSTVSQYMFALILDVLAKRVAGYDYIAASVR